MPVFSKTVHVAIFALGMLCTATPDDAPPPQARLLKSTPFFNLYQTGEITYVLETRKGMYPKVGCNTAFVVTPRGVVVIDAHMTPEADAAAIREIQAITKQPIRYLVQTHLHDDHVLGNRTYGPDVKILAPRKSMENVTEERLGEWRQPDRFLSAPKRLFSGRDSVLILPVGRAHTEGDLIVYVPRDRVVLLGDLQVRGMVGYLGEGHLREWIRALDRVSMLRVNVAVPGHGTIGTLAQVREYRRYLGEFTESAAAHLKQHGTLKGYRLPERYRGYGAQQTFMSYNLERTEELWKEGTLTSKRFDTAAEAKEFSRYLTAFLLKESAWSAVEGSDSRLINALKGTATAEFAGSWALFGVGARAHRALLSRWSPGKSWLKSVKSALPIAAGQSLAEWAYSGSVTGDGLFTAAYFTAFDGLLRRYSQTRPFWTWRKQTVALAAALSGQEFLTAIVRGGRSASRRARAASTSADRPAERR